MIAKFLHENPRLLMLVLGLIVAVGLTSFAVLPRMEDPVLVKRIGVVRTAFPGADALRVESLVSRPIEDGLGDITGVKEIFSQSIAGISSMRVELEDHVENVDEVWSLVRDKLDDLAANLPEGAHDPQFSKPEMKAFATIIALKWRGAGEANYTILHRLGKELESVLRSVSGTENVELSGAPQEEVVVELDPKDLETLGMTVVDIAREIEASDTKVSAGLVRGRRNDLVIELAGESDPLRRLETTQIQVGQPEAGGRLVDLAEIATITKGIADPPSSLALIDGASAVVASAVVRDEQRIDHWHAALQPELRDFEATLPSDIELDVVFAQNDYVEVRLRELIGNLLLAMLAVVVVIFFMMGWRSMIVVGSALPLSAMLVLGGMRWLEVPIHHMSVTGLIIALGLLIDNAIIIVDEVRSRLRNGERGVKSDRRQHRPPGDSALRLDPDDDPRLRSDRALAWRCWRIRLLDRLQRDFGDQRFVSPRDDRCPRRHRVDSAEKV